MNSYFASVEQQANPLLRGRGVGVCAYLGDNGVIIASSIEAKAKGIKTGTKVREAKFLDPDIVLLENEPAKYRSTTEKIFNILQEYSDKIEPYSIDEAFVDLTGWVKDFDEALMKSKEIQSRIKNEIGEWLGSSVGISWTKFLSKFAGDIAPKKSVLVIENEKRLIEILKNRSLQDAWGINIRMETRLKAIGINNLLELKNYDKFRIKKILGRYGYYLWANMNGEEVAQVSNGTPTPKSVGHSYSLPKWTRDKDYLKKIFYKLCEKTGRRLRNLDREAQNMSIGIGYTREGGVYRSFKTKDAMFTTEEIFRNLEVFFDNIDLIMPVRSLAISVRSLLPVSNQMSLFEDNLSKKELSKALDRINDRYGEYVVMRGRMFNTEDMAKDRIGFRKLN